MDRFLDEQENLALQAHSLSSSSSSINNIQSSTSRLQSHTHSSTPSSYHLAPQSTQLIQTNLIKPDSVMETLAAYTASICDSVSGIGTAGSGYMNGLLKNNNSRGNSSSPSKHFKEGPLTSDWVQSTTTLSNGPELVSSSLSETNVSFVGTTSNVNNDL